MYSDTVSYFGETRRINNRATFNAGQPAQENHSPYLTYASSKRFALSKLPNMVRVTTARRLILVGCTLLIAGWVPRAFGEEDSLAGDAPQGTVQNEVPILDESKDDDGRVTSVVS